LIADSTRHVVSIGLQALLVAAIAAALAFAAATVAGSAPGGADSVLAAKGGPAGGGGSTTSSWISLAQTEGLAAASPSLGSTVTFAAGYPSNKSPRVEVLCYQPADPSGLALFDPARGYLVYGETGDMGQALGDGTSPLGYNGFLLGGGMSAWLLNGGPADCTANLFYFGQHAGTQTFNVLASTSFAAS
jgi:hypothetical protein